ncbi:MAG TPA: metallopeptidase family protein [Verrucomicrobiae bacterium]
MSSPFDGEDWPQWLEVAQKTVETTIAELPEDLREHVIKLPITYERTPSPELIADDIEPDTLGLFVGQPFPDSVASPEVIPAQIILYLENIREFSENDPELYREEVQTTFLHELGHYLGLDEQDLADRELD